VYFDVVPFLSFLIVASSTVDVPLPVRIVNQTGEPLYHYTARITILEEYLPGVPHPVDFDKTRFFQDSEGTQPLDFWMEQSLPGDKAVFWVRVPELNPGTNEIWLIYDETADEPYQATTLTAMLLGTEGLRLDLQTDPPDKETIHPSVIVAEGWMAKRYPDDPPTINRVLVDTLWPQDSSPYPHSNHLENPAVWLSEDEGLTWSWPPEVATNPAWPKQNNWLVDKPDCGNYSDPDAIFLRAHSLPSGGPDLDTLRVYHRSNCSPGSNVVYIDVTSPGEAWSEVQIDGANPTNLSDVTSRFLSPAVWQEEDGSLSMWAGNKDHETCAITLMRYTSQDGVNFTPVGQVHLGLPANLWGPWHLDVIKAGGVYWMIGSFGPLDPGQAHMVDSYMLRSEDGLNFELLLPTVLERTPPAHWFYPGSYRPSLLYIPEHGLEVYVGSCAGNTSQPGDGGTGRWCRMGTGPSSPDRDHQHGLLRQRPRLRQSA